MYFLAVDIESTGRGTGVHFVPCFGACIVGPDGKVIGTFKRYLAQPANREWEERCVEQFWNKFPDMYGKTLEEIRTAGAVPAVMAEFRAWVHEVTDDKDAHIVFDTASYDGAWLETLLGETSSNYLMRKRNDKGELEEYYRPTRDISSYLLGAAGAPFGKSGMKAFCERFGLQRPVWAVKPDHDPGNDATCIALDAWWAHKQLGLV